MVDVFFFRCSGYFEVMNKKKPRREGFAKDHIIIIKVEMNNNNTVLVTTGQNTKYDNRDVNFAIRCVNFTIQKRWHLNNISSMHQ